MSKQKAHAALFPPRKGALSVTSISFADATGEPKLIRAPMFCIFTVSLVNDHNVADFMLFDTLLHSSA